MMYLPALCLLHVVEVARCCVVRCIHKALCLPLEVARCYCVNLNYVQLEMARVLCLLLDAEVVMCPVCMMLRLGMNHLPVIANRSGTVLCISRAT